MWWRRPLVWLLFKVINVKEEPIRASAEQAVALRFGTLVNRNLIMRPKTGLLIDKFIDDYGDRG